MGGGSGSTANTAQGSPRETFVPWNCPSEPKKLFSRVENRIGDRRGHMHEFGTGAASAKISTNGWEGEGTLFGRRVALQRLFLFSLM